MALKFRQIAFLFIFMTISGFTEPEKTEGDTVCLANNIEFFYINPDSPTAQQTIREIARLGALDDFFYVFVALAKEYPKEIIGWFSASQVAIEKHPKIIHALHWGGLNGEAIRFAQKANWSLDEIFSLGKNIAPILNLPVDFPGYVSCLCSHFFVTGDIRYIRRVIDVLEVGPSLIKDPPTSNELREEARDTLTRLFLTHEKVYRLCCEEAKTRKGEAATFLSTLPDWCYRAYKERFPLKEIGVLSGFVFITEDPHFEEQWASLPTMKIPDFNRVVTIPYPQKNQNINVYVMFTGMELDKDLMSHVTYDLEILDPKGNKMVFSPNLQGIHRKISSSLLLQKADESVTFEFCPLHKTGQEKMTYPGTYQVNAYLKDHIGGKEIKLSSTLEVQPRKCDKSEEK